jgi:hypothetical protein
MTAGCNEATGPLDELDESSMNRPFWVDILPKCPYTRVIFLPKGRSRFERVLAGCAR